MLTLCSVFPAAFSTRAQGKLSPLWTIYLMNLLPLSMYELSGEILGYFDQDIYFFSRDDNAMKAPM